MLIRQHGITNKTPPIAPAEYGKYSKLMCGLPVALQDCEYMTSVWMERFRTLLEAGKVAGINSRSAVVARVFGAVSSCHWFEQA